MRAFLMCAVLLSGCSYFFQNRLPDEYSGQSEPFCSSSNRIAVLDTLEAVAYGIVAAGAAADRQDFAGNNNTEQSVLMVTGIVGAVLWTASAVDGYGMTNECRDARARWDGRGAPTTTDEDSKRQLRLMRQQAAPADAGVAPADAEQ